MRYIIYILDIIYIYKISRTYIICIFFFFQVSQPGTEPRHPSTLYTDDVKRYTIGHVGHPIYDLNDSPIYISHTFDLIYIWNI